MPPDGDEPDPAARLLDAARRGDASALGALLERFREYLLTVAQGEAAAGLRAKAGASDVVQETFVEAQRLFARFEGAKSEQFRAWLRAILLNKLAELNNRYFGTHARDPRRERSMDQSGDAGPLRDAIPGAHETPSVEAARGEDERALLDALGRLPEDDRRVIEWRNWEKLPFAEIGRRLGRSEDAARMLFGRALERLGNELKRTHARPDTPGG